MPKTTKGGKPKQEGVTALGKANDRASAKARRG